MAEEEDDKKKDGGEIKSDEEFVHKEKDKNDKEEIDDIKKLALMPKQPDQVKLEEMRRFKLKQKLMYRIIKEILSYIIFVMILLTVAYGNRDYRSHHVNNALTSYFMGGTYSGKMTIDDVSMIKYDVSMIMYNNVRLLVWEGGIYNMYDSVYAHICLNGESKEHWHFNQTVLIETLNLNQKMCPSCLASVFTSTSDVHNHNTK